MNTINNQFFEQHPNKVLGEFSIAPYMNKIIVKGSKDDVVKYFDSYDWSGSSAPKTQTSVFELWIKYAKENPQNTGQPNYLDFGSRLKLSEQMIDDLYKFNFKYIDCALSKYSATSLDELNSICDADKKALDDERPNREFIVDKLFNRKKQKAKTVIQSNETQEAIEMLSELSETLSGKELAENNEAIELLKDLL